MYRFIQQNSKNPHDFKGILTLSIGDGIGLDSRYSYDASRRPQSIHHRQRKSAKTASLNVVFSKATIPNIFDEISKYELLSGRTGALEWAGEDLGIWCVRDVSISFAVDAVDIVSGVQVSMNLSEAYVTKNAGNKVVTVRVL